MQNNQSQINIPFLGMDRDNHPTRIKENSYTFAKNISLEDSSGNGNPVVQNEPSNLLCQNFGESFKDIGGFINYKIVGFRFNSSMGRTYFFFVNTNPESPFYKTSVIGYINQHVVEFNSSDSEEDCNCATLGILDEPLELIEQKNSCEFKIIVEDSCNKCLGFSIDNPIYSRNIRFKNEQCGRRMYWTDRTLSGPRYIDLDMIEKEDWKENIYHHTGNIVCGNEALIEETCFDCNKIKMIPDYEIPCILPTNISLGGNLKLGTYEFYIAYCDEEGNELSNYFNNSGPVDLFDYNNVTLNQTELDKVTNYAIELKVSNLDEDFHFYKIAVVQHTEVNGEESYFIEGIHPITDKTVLYTTERGKIRTTLNNILIKRIKVQSIEQLVDSNGYLFMAGIKNKPAINLQPIVNLMGPFLKWTTVIAKEDFYKNGINASLSRSYMRDEVYPFSFSLGMADGTETHDFILINRAPTSYDLKRIGDNSSTDFEPLNLNVKSILKGKNVCGGNERVYRWQFENTATKKGVVNQGVNCDTPEERDEYIQNIISQGGYLKKEFNSTCQVQDMNGLNIANDLTIEVLGDDYIGFSNLEEYLNSDNNLQDYTTPGSPVYNSQFAPYLDLGRYIDFNCSAINSCNCNNEELIFPSLSIDSVTLQTKNPVTYQYYPFTAMAAKPLPFIESLFIYNQRDADSSFNNKYVYKNFAQAAYRGVRKTGNTPESANLLNVLSDIDVRNVEGFTLPNMGTRIEGTAIESNEKLFFTEFTANTIPDTASWLLDPLYISSYTNDQKDDNDFNFREVWGVIKVNQMFKPQIARNALWSKTRDISEFPFIEINFKTSEPSYGLDDNNEVLDSLFDYNTQVITINSDVVTNRVGKVRVSIFPKNSTGGGALKTIFLDKNTDNFLDLRTQLGVSSGEFLITIDTPVQKLEAYEVNFNRNINDSGLLPGVSETPEKFRIWSRTSSGLLIWHHIFRGKARVVPKQFETSIGYIFWGGPNYDDVDGTVLVDNKSWTTTSIDFSFLIVQRGKEVSKYIFNVDEIIIKKTEEYNYDCYFDDLEKKICDGQPFEEGSFAYWESNEEYPDNPELFNSSDLRVIDGNRPLTESDLSELVTKNITDYWDGDVFSSGETFLEVFKNNFSSGSDLLSKDKTDFTCKPIRHFKFPSGDVVPFIHTDKTLDFSGTFIFPIGVTISPEIINVFLDLAVKVGYLTQEQRDSFVSFKLKRGDRTIEKSVISKGLISDLIRYKEDGDYKYFPNFPFNSLKEKDLIIQNSKPLKHQYLGKCNNMFAFSSPEIDYGLEVKPTEILVEGIQSGAVEGKLNQVDEHAKMVILSGSAQQLALDLARTEAIFEFVSLLADLGIQAAQAMSGGGFLGFSGLVAGGVSAGLLAGVLAIRGTQQKNRVAELRVKWLDAFKKMGIGFNFAHYITSVADYNNFNTEFSKNHKLRFIEKFKLMNEGNYNINSISSGGLTKVNNIDRERSMFINLGSNPKTDGLVYPDYFIGLDDTNSEPVDNSTLKSTFEGTAANIYTTLKVWKPSQYGTLGNIKWIDTTGCNYLKGDGKRNIIFGGDTFISKYSFKKKFNYFLVSMMNQADYTPFKYSQYFNVIRPKYYIDYETEEQRLGSSLIPATDSKYVLKDVIESSNYVSNGKFFHYQYGIPYFFVESTINCWNRYAGNDPWENFYPNVGDYIEWTQENKVSIRKPNVFKYNYSYSLSGIAKNGNFLPNNYNAKFYNCTNNSPNGIMYSAPDVSEKQKVDPWLVYKNFDFYNFSTSNGKLIDLLNIESTQILGIFENQVSIFNAIDTLREKITPETKELGQGGIFAQRPLDFHRTDLGYAGTQHKSSVSCEFGHFWTDARRGQVFQVNPNGEGLTEITVGLRNWFKEQLPFKILKGQIDGLTDLDLDNPFKNLGISMGWDSRYKRVFLTKLDYIVNKKYINELEYVLRDGVKEDDVNLDFLSTNKYIRVKKDSKLPDAGKEVDFSDTTIFEPVHFTVAYSPITKSWISYYDFTPGFYISFNNYFATGGNHKNGPSIWNHLLTNKSFGVFNGEKYPWKLEVITKEQYTHKTLTNVEYWIDSIRYKNEFDYALNRKLGLDKAMIYNNSDSSGLLNLIPKEENNRYQVSQYPKVNSNGSIDILTTFNDGKWSFNDFYNRVTNIDYNVPLFKYDRNTIDKEFNSKALTFNNRWLDRVRGDWFFLRFEGGSDTRFKQVFKWLNPQDNITV